MIVFEIAAKVALALALIGPQANHDEPSGEKLPVREGIKIEPTPTPDPPTTYVGGGALSAAQVESYARAAGFPESALSTMVGYAARESGFCPTAVYGYGCDGAGHFTSGGPACGLWQLWPCPGPEAANPATNAALAFAKYEASGFAPWGG